MATIATRKCGFCGNPNFTSVEGSVLGSDNPVQFIQCTACGSVVGATDNMYVLSLIKQLLKEINKKFPEAGS